MSKLGFWRAASDAALPEADCAEIRGIGSDFGGRSNKAYGGLPIEIASNFAGASDMRLGNTPVELSLSSWRPYSQSVPWLLPTSGPWRRVVYMQVRAADFVRSIELQVPDFNDRGLRYRSRRWLRASGKDPRPSGLRI